MVDTGDLKSPACKSVRVRVSSMANEKAGFDLPFSLARLVETRNGATAKAGKSLRWSVFSGGGFCRTGHPLCLHICYRNPCFYNSGCTFSLLFLMLCIHNSHHGKNGCIKPQVNHKSLLPKILESPNMVASPCRFVLPFSFIYNIWMQSSLISVRSVHPNT